MTAYQSAASAGKLHPARVVVSAERKEGCTARHRNPSLSYLTRILSAAALYDAWDMT